MDDTFRKYYDIIKKLDFDACLEVRRKIMDPECNPMANVMQDNYNPYINSIFYGGQVLEELQGIRKIVEDYKLEGKEILSIAASSSPIRGDILVGVEFPEPLKEDLKISLNLSPGTDQKCVEYTVKAGAKNYVFREPALIALWALHVLKPLPQGTLWYRAHLPTDDRRILLSRVNKGTYQ